MRLAGVTAETKAPQGGHIGLDEHGSLNELLRDTAVVLMGKARPSASMEERIEGHQSRICILRCHRYGVRPRLLCARRRR